LAIIATVVIAVLYAVDVSPIYGLPVVGFYIAGVSWIRSRPEPPPRPDPN
jgi:hypothetical protein